MKKAVFSLTLLLGLTTAAHAQTGTLRYGLKGGFNLSSYSGQLDGPFAAGYQPGFAAGAVAAYGLSDHATLQVEALYSRKGVFVDSYPYRYPASPLFGSWRYRSALSYLDVPVLAKLSTGAASTGFYLELGPQLSLALGQREYVTPYGSSGSAANPPAQTLSTDRNALTPVALGYVGGVGYQFANGLGLGLRYTGDVSHV